MLVRARVPGFLVVFILSAMAIAATPIRCNPPPVGQVTLMTYNAAHDLEYTNDDRDPDKQLNPWRRRIDDAANDVVRVEKPQIIGLQEVLSKQETDCRACETTGWFTELDYIVKKFREAAGFQYAIAYSVRENAGYRQGRGLNCFQRMLATILYDPATITVDTQFPTVCDARPYAIQHPDATLPGPQSCVLQEGKDWVRFSGVILAPKKAPVFRFFVFNTHMRSELFEKTIAEAVKRRDQLVARDGNTVLPPIALGDFNDNPRDGGAWSDNFLPVFEDGVDLILPGVALNGREWVCDSLAEYSGENGYKYSDHPIRVVRLSLR